MKKNIKKDIMTTVPKNANRGYLYKNKNKKETKHPDLKGKITIEGKEWQVASWESLDKNTGEIYFSLIASENTMQSANNHANNTNNSNNAKSSNNSSNVNVSNNNISSSEKKSAVTDEDLSELEKLFGESPL